MDEFFDEMQQLRDAVEHKQIYHTASTDAWNTLTSSMDALEDTHHAISAFVAAASKPVPKLKDRELGERYLRTYGVMQAGFRDPAGRCCQPPCVARYAGARPEGAGSHQGLQGRSGGPPNAAGPAQKASAKGALHLSGDTWR